MQLETTTPHYCQVVTTINSLMPTLQNCKLYTYKRLHTHTPGFLFTQIQLYSIYCFCFFTVEFIRIRLAKLYRKTQTNFGTNPVYVYLCNFRAIFIV